MFNWNKKPKSTGQLGEEFAQKEYKKLGFTIIAANEYNKKGKQMGEIDFIAKNKEKIVFVEVKSRTDGDGKFGSGFEAVDMFKQVKLLRAVKIYILHNTKYQSLIPQIDVCVVRLSSVDNTPESATIVANAVEDWG